MKDSYKVDNSNRLIIKRPRKALRPDGAFDVDKQNRLVYWLNEPQAWRRKYALPAKLTFFGKWQLNQNYDLEMVLNEDEESMAIKGEIISTDRDTLVFAFTTEDRQGLKHLRILKLSGSWQADEHNRLTFLVERKTRPDTLLFKSAWQVNKNQQLAYTYEKTDLIRKTKAKHVLAFEGFWQIDSANRLVYILERSSNSAFSFRAQVESPSLYPKAGTIKYRLGIGLRGKDRVKEKIISLFGAWKFSKQAGISFVIDYGMNRIRAIEFGTEVNFTKKDRIGIALTGRQGEPVGLNLTFTHKFLQRNSAEAFLKLKKSARESGVEAGLRVPF